MSTARTTEAFKSGSGGIDSHVIAVLIQATASTLALLVAIWMLISLYRGLTQGGLSIEDFFAGVVRALLLLVIFFWLVLS